MHYDDPTIMKEQMLEIIVYNHEWGPIRKKKDGTLYRSSVRYEVASIRRCKLFPPKLLAEIIKDPYRFFNARLSELPFDHWYLVTIQAKAYGQEVQDFTIVDVTDLKNDDTLFLH